MSYLGYYFLVKLDNIYDTFNTIAVLSVIIVSVIIGFLFILYSLDQDENVFKIIKKYKKPVLWYLTIVIFLTTFIPTSKQMAFIIIAPEIVENGAVKETFKNIPELAQLGTEYLKEMLKEKVNERN